jgi:hypothetical protein
VGVVLCLIGFIPSPPPNHLLCNPLLTPLDTMASVWLNASMTQLKLEQFAEAVDCATHAITILGNSSAKVREDG